MDFKFDEPVRLLTPGQHETRARYMHAWPEDGVSFVHCDTGPYAGNSIAVPTSEVAREH